jgi:hypothetical protein
MTLVASQVRVPGTGELFVAPVGTAAPTDTDTALAAAWKGLGYTTEDGVTLSRSLEREPVNAWQSLTPLRYIYNAATLGISAAMLQSNQQVASLWWGGGDFAETVASSGVFQADMPVVPEGTEQAVLLEFSDDDIKTRIWVAKMDLAETGDIALNRQGATAFQLTFNALAPDSGSVMASWITDDPAFAPPGP